MKNILIAVLLSPLITLAQSIEQGDITVNLGIEGGFYSNQITHDFFGVETTEKDTAATYFIPIAVEYMVTNRVGLGVIFKPGEYYTDEPNQTNKARVFGATGSFHVINTDVVDIMPRVGFGFSTLNILDTALLGQEANFSGAFSEIDLIARFFFGERIGMSTGFGYNTYNLNLSEWKMAGEQLNLDDVDWNMRVRGFELNFNLVVKI